MTILQKHPKPETLETQIVERAKQLPDNSPVLVACYTSGALAEAYEALYNDVCGVLGNRETAGAKISGWALAANLWPSQAEIEDLLDLLGFSQLQLQESDDEILPRH